MKLYHYGDCTLVYTTWPRNYKIFYGHVVEGIPSGWKIIEYQTNGLLNRINGPAVIHCNGYSEWWHCGKYSGDI